MAAFTLEPLGDCALLISIGGALAPSSHRLARQIEAAADPLVGAALIDCIPTLSSLTVVYDPLVTEFEPLAAALAQVLAASAHAAANLARRQHRIPVIYDGPDLPAVAERCGLSVAEAIALHSGALHTVAFLGFLPGFPYLSGLPARLHLPRLASPRARVAAGSVAIANDQTGIYPQESPGGWHLIGRTEWPLFDPQRWPPAALEPGDSVIFEAIAP